MVEGFGLWLSLWWGGEGGLGFGGRVGGGEECDFFADGTAKVVEGFANVGWIVVGFVRVLGAVGVLVGVCEEGEIEQQRIVRHSEHFLVGLTKGIDALFELDVVVGEFGLDMVSI